MWWEWNASLACYSSLRTFVPPFVPPVNETGVVVFFSLQKSRLKAKTLHVALKHSELYIRYALCIKTSLLVKHLMDSDGSH